MVDLSGEVVGQVNGLAVYDLGDFSFGRPSRITARTYAGRSGVINIEREAQLSGRTHDKGVLILSGYLGSKFAQDMPLALSASLSFEQSYEGRGRGQCLVHGALRHPVQPCRRPHCPGHRRHRFRQPARRDTAHRRREREGRGVLRPVPHEGAHRRARCGSSSPEREEPDASERTWSTPSREAISTSTP